MSISLHAWSQFCLWCSFFSDVFLLCLFIVFLFVQSISQGIKFKVHNKGWLQWISNTFCRPSLWCTLTECCFSSIPSQDSIFSLVLLSAFFWLSSVVPSGIVVRVPYPNYLICSFGYLVLNLELFECKILV